MSEVVKAKNKKFYNPKTRSYASRIDINQKGFLCTCNTNVKNCIREAYNLLNKYDEITNGASTSDEKKNEEKHVDINDEMAEELAALKKEQKNDRKFHVADSGAKNVVFIRTTVEDPVKLAHGIVKDIFETKLQQTKVLIRLIPIEITCKAYEENITKAIEPLLGKYFKEKPTTFSIVINVRNNSNFNKEEIIKTVASNVSKIREDHKVSLKEAEISIVIEIIKGVALIGVVPDFCKYKKYNLHAFIE